MVLTKANLEKEGLTYLQEAIKLYPFHWGAWVEIASKIGTLGRVCK